MNRLIPGVFYMDADFPGKTTADTFPSSVVLPNENSSVYEGINVMEYYIR